jgi:hypothetical protein
LYALALKSLTDDASLTGFPECEWHPARNNNDTIAKKAKTPFIILIQSFPCPYY